MNEEDRIVAVASVGDRITQWLLSLWWSLRWSDFQDGYSSALPEMVEQMALAQTESAGYGAQWANEAAPGGTVRVKPDAFAGWASDGRTMASLLVQPMVQTFAAASQGAQAPVALQFGADSLERIAQTQVEDVARAGEQVVIAANTKIRGYLRLVEPKACGRCVILAGRFYRWNDGFDRHPSCRCTHKPITGGWTDADQDPRQLFDGMSRADQDRAFTKAGAEAIRLGADPAKVVNARRGMSTATSASGRALLTRRDVLGQQVFTTTVGTGRTRAERRKAPVRLMPESIIELATDRADAIRLLQVHGYLN